jgi:ABC-2 type transport system permease protein
VTRRQAIVLVASREFRERLRGRSFRASTALMVLAVLGVVGLSAWTSDGGPVAVTVVTTPGASDAEAVAVELDAAFGLELEPAPARDEADARAAVSDGEADAALTGGAIVVARGAPDEVAPLLQEATRRVLALESLEQAGLTRAEARDALAAEPPPVVLVGEGGDDAAGLAFVVTLLLYVGLFTFGYYVSSGVVEEKSSRVVEVVLAAIRPLTLLAGKVIGIGLLGLAQLAVIAAAGLAATSLFGGVDVPDATTSTIAIALLYFVLGYAFYACAFAAAGAIVTRQEDLQSTTAPISVALVGSYLAVLPVLDDPTSTLARVTTLLPPTAPLTVPARAAQGALPAWELALSLVLMVAGILVVLLAATRIYERSILRLGSPLTLRQALRLVSR